MKELLEKSITDLLTVFRNEKLSEEEKKSILSVIGILQGLIITIC